MITDILLWILSFILGIVAGVSNIIAHNWTVWPAAVLNGLTYFFTTLVRVDFLFCTITLLEVVKFLVNFFTIYFIIKLLLSIFNWARGAGELDV